MQCVGLCRSECKFWKLSFTEETGGRAFCCYVLELSISLQVARTRAKRLLFQLSSIVSVGHRSMFLREESSMLLLGLGCCLTTMAHVCLSPGRILTPIVLAPAPHT